MKKQRLWLGSAALGLAFTLPVSMLAWGQNPVAIYQWTDEQGQQHYSDRPPPGQPANLLDPSQGALSTIGGSALRDDEKALLDRYAEEAQIRLEQAQAEAQAQPQAPIIVVEPAPAQDRYILPATGWHYGLRDNRQYSRWGLNFSITSGKEYQGKHKPRHRHPKPDHPKPVQPLPDTTKPSSTIKPLRRPPSWRGPVAHTARPIGPSKQAPRTR